jgi:hypothetical protein
MVYLRCSRIINEILYVANDDVQENRRYWKLKEEALDRSVWRTRFGRGYGPVVRQTAE